MAEIFAQLNGNASASSMWSGGASPTTGDTIINPSYVISFDYDVTLGTTPDPFQWAGSVANAPNPSAAIWSKGGTLTIMKDVTLTLKGDFLLWNTRLIMEDGAKIIFDTTGNSLGNKGFYVLDISLNYGNNIGHARLVTNGTEANPCEISWIGEGFGLITAGRSWSGSAGYQGSTSKRSAGQIQATFTKFKNLGCVPKMMMTETEYGSHPLKKMGISYYKVPVGIEYDWRVESTNTVHTDVFTMEFNDCIFEETTGIGYVYDFDSGSANHKLIFDRCVAKKTKFWLRNHSFIRLGSARTYNLGSDPDNGAANGAAYKTPQVTGVRRMRDCTFDREIQLNYAAIGWEIEGNVFCDGFYMVTAGGWSGRGCNTMRGNLFSRSDQWQSPSSHIDFLMPIEWYPTASPALYAHYGCSPMEDYGTHKPDYQQVMWGSGGRADSIPAELSGLTTPVTTWVEANFFLEDSSRQNPHYVKPNYGNGNGIHVFKDNVWEGSRVSGDGEFLRASLFFNEARTVPSKDTGAIYVIGNLALGTSNEGSGGSFNHLIDTPYSSGHPMAGLDVIPSTYPDEAQMTNSGYYFGGYFPHFYSNNTIYMGLGEGAMNLSEAGSHYQVIRYNKNNIFWDVEKRAGGTKTYAMGDVSRRSQPDTVMPEDVGYNLKINASGEPDYGMTGWNTDVHTAGSGQLTYNNNGYFALELINNTRQVSGVDAINAFGLTDIEFAIPTRANLPFVNYQVNSGYYAKKLTGIQSSTVAWQGIARARDWSDATRDVSFSITGLMQFVRGSNAPIYSAYGVVSPLDPYTAYKDPALTVGGNPLGAVNHLPYAATHDFSKALITLTSDYGCIGAVPFSAPNRAPIAAADIYSVQQDSSIVITFESMLANDTDLDVGDNIVVSYVGQPSHGSNAVNTALKKITYTPTSGFYGFDSFTYSIQDPRGGESSGTVTINVVNQAPIAASHSYTNVSGEFLIVPKVDLLVGAVDPDGNDANITFFDAIDPNDGTTVSFAGNDFVYKAKVGFEGLQIITYRIRDQAGVLGSGSITVVVSPPVGSSSVLTADEQQQLADASKALKLATFLALK